MQGYDSQGGFEAFRRYSDFYLLRSYMKNKWLGLYVPGVPPKKVIVSTIQGAMQPVAVESRRKLLNSFCLAIAQIHYLYGSEEYQLFIRGRDAFEKEAARLPEPQLAQTRRIYQVLFESEPDCTETASLADFEHRLGNTITQAKHLKVKLKSLVQYHKGLEAAHHHLAEGVRTFEASVYSQYAESPNYRVVKTAVSEAPSPFQVLRDWAAWEYVEVTSMLEGIQARNLLLSQRDRADRHRIDLKKHISKRQKGKRSFFSFRKKRTTEELEADLQTIEREIADLAVICTLSERWLLRHQIPLFKVQRAAAYQSAVREFAGVMVPDAHFILQSFTSMNQLV